MLQNNFVGGLSLFMPNFICLRHCVQGKMQVSQKFTDKPRTYKLKKENTFYVMGCVHLSHFRNKFSNRLPKMPAAILRIFRY